MIDLDAKTCLAMMIDDFTNLTPINLYCYNLLIFIRLSRFVLYFLSSCQ